jgi:hypothetical protein
MFSELSDLSGNPVVQQPQCLDEVDAASRANGVGGNARASRAWKGEPRVGLCQRLLSMRRWYFY